MQDILLLHGAIGAEEQLKGLRDQLTGTHYRVHSFNFSGHGGKPVTRPLSMILFAEELHTYIEQHRLKEPYVFGYSMGGYVAMYLSARYPELISKMVTLGTKYEWSPEIAAKEIKMLRPEVIEEKIPAFAAALAKRHGAGEWKSLLKATADLLVQLGNMPLLHPDNLSGITAKVLLLIGDRDNMVSLEETKAVQNQLQHGSLMVLPDTAHPIEQVDPKMLAEKVLGFFNS